MRFVLGIDDDHSEFLRRFAADPLLRRPVRLLRGLRPLRTQTVAHALLRALAGQLITAREARAIERAVIRAATPELDGLRAPPTAADLRRFSPAELRRLGLGARRGAALVRLCRSLDLEALRALPTDAAARRLERERGLGPWSVGVVCLQGLGRYERGLARDLGLVKLASALWGRRVEPEETDALLAPYGEWAGLASVYLLAGYQAGLVGFGDADRDPRRRQDRRVAARRAA
jgi:3-methyladenine DNA glycosylase/8-oxoguanine DNA glycosylase